MTDDRIRILVSRHSAFYSPLIATIAAGFLEEEGLEADYGVLPAGKRARDLIRAGEVDIVQAAVSSNWKPMEDGERDLPVHFAQINRRDGFFIAAREPDPSFHWKKLEGRSLVADHGGQPLYMLKFAVHQQGVDWRRIHVVDAGGIEEIDSAFRSGKGDYVHQQGPSPQQLEKDGIGFVVASVGAAMPPVSFSSLMSSREFIGSQEARSFMRAYRKGREWVRSLPAGEIAAREAVFFTRVDPDALTTAIANYQQLGCWDGEPEISRELYQQALAVFLHCGVIRTEHPYEEVVVPPPGTH